VVSDRRKSDCQDGTESSYAKQDESGEHGGSPWRLDFRSPGDAGRITPSATFPRAALAASPTGDPFTGPVILLRVLARTLSRLL
jgi:hypothetical protein